MAITNNLFVWGNENLSDHDLATLVKDANGFVPGAKGGNLVEATELNSGLRSSSLVGYSLIELLRSGPDTTWNAALGDITTTYNSEVNATFDYTINDSDLPTFCSDLKTALDKYLKYSGVFHAVQANVWTTARTFEIEDYNGANTGASISVDGSSNVTLTLPWNIEVNLDLNSTLDAVSLEDIFEEDNGGHLTYVVKEATYATSATNASYASSAGKVASKFTATLNGTATQYDGSAAKSVSFYAPTTVGYSYEILCGNGTGNAPLWLDVKDLHAGALVNSSRNLINVGSVSQPVYFQNGVPVACNFSSGTITFTTGSLEETDDVEKDPMTATRWVTWDNTLFGTWMKIGKVLKVSLKCYKSPSQDHWIRLNLGELLYKVGFKSSTAQGETYMQSNDNIQRYLSCTITARHSSSDGYTDEYMFDNDTDTNLKYLYFCKGEAGNNGKGFAMEITMYLF